MHNEYMQTTKEDIYIAGDSANIEEESTAVIEGKIAGLHALNSLKSVEGYEEKMKSYLKRLEELRGGEFGRRPKAAKEKIYEGYYEEVGRRRNS